MKILYSIQATGNGHLSRANEILPILKTMCSQLDVCVSGTSGDISLNYPIKYKLRGISFIVNKKGAIDYIKTLQQLKLKKFREDIKKINIEQYDLLINDFEPVSAWAAKLNNIPCIGLSHQSAVANYQSPRPKNKNIFAELILKYFAPSDSFFGFHFDNYDEKIYTPIIRKAIRFSKPTTQKHYTVYLPAFSTENLIKYLSKYSKVKWHIFSNKVKKESQIGNFTLIPIDNENFAQSLIHCNGVLCGAGFETPAEALFLGKKLLVIPLKGQYEQACNAAALEGLGVNVIKGLKKKKHQKIISNWLENENPIVVKFEDQTTEILKTVIEHYKLIPKYKEIATVKEKYSFPKLELSNFF